MSSDNAQPDQKIAAFFDIDGTLTSERLWKGMLEYFKRNGSRRWTHRAYIGLNFPTYILRKMGLISEVAFRRPWAANMAWYLRGCTPEDCEPMWNWVVEEYMQGAWREDSIAILKQYLKKGVPVVLVSSGPQPLTQHVARELGTEHAVGTKLEMRDGRYTGRSLKPVCIGEFKASLAKAYLAEVGFDVDLAASYAYADSTSDLGLLEMVGHPVATYPDEGLRKVAIERGWEIFPR